MPERCHYCRRAADTLDHIVPRAKGGTDREWNLIPACQWCNDQKKDSWPTCVCARCLWAEYRWQRGDRQPTTAVRKELRRARLVRRAEARKAAS